MRVCAGLSCMYYARNPCAQSLRLFPSAISQRRIVRGWRGQVPLCICSIQSSTMPALALADYSLKIWLLAKMPRDDDHGRWTTHPQRFCNPSRYGMKRRPYCMNCRVWRQKFVMILCDKLKTLDSWLSSALAVSTTGTHQRPHATARLKIHLKYFVLYLVLAAVTCTLQIKP